MTSFLNGSLASLNTISSAISGQGQAPTPNSSTFQPPTFPSGSGTGLPAAQIPYLQPATSTRNIAHWLVPDVGIVNMYINPQSIQYNYKKLITPNRTKGGYVIQYWGEELTTLILQGHTGSSGVEGLNVLEQIYRSEQYLFDPIALTMAASQSTSGLNTLVDSVLGNLGGLGATISQGTQGLLGLDPASQNILPQTVPSLGALATSIEFYYSGWVFRGYFTNFSVTESVQQLGLFVYNIGFTVTQRRGYRTNNFAWQRSAIAGPSNAATVPLSVSELAKQ